MSDPFYKRFSFRQTGKSLRFAISPDTFSAVLSPAGIREDTSLRLSRKNVEALLRYVSFSIAIPLCTTRCRRNSVPRADANRPPRTASDRLERLLPIVVAPLTSTPGDRTFGRAGRTA